MREIKFRAWNKTDKVMFEVFGFDVNTIYPWQRECDPEIPIAPDAEDCTLMQYIGTDDKNGKGIYEGDIVDCLRDGDEQYIECVVINDIRNLPRALFGSSVISREVIGNIYENPELVK